MDFRPRRATQADFRTRHAYLSTSPDSSFVRTCSVQRRDATGVDVLTGCVLTRVGAGGRPPLVLDTAGDWYAALHDVFGLALDDVDTDERARLWSRIRAAHVAWLAA